ncbi:hypothetical protein ACJRO7_021822 [Eucalyptus globulus]|uniref:Uncharacterized protein n=1 Tax=Eucalyptus globulus TaxID=34317 RepID=A0ABD3KQZ9_EUCGL
MHKKKKKEREKKAVINCTYKEDGENEIGNAPTTGRILAGRPEPVAAIARF